MGILDEVPIDYIKWDYNRNMTEIGTAAPGALPGEVLHKYMLGLYEVMEALVTKYPNILFESCSGGGGRYDPGILYYMPQTWTSDNTDAVARLEIQYGTSLVMPISSMGSHVSAIPNHQVHRMTSMKMRGDVAMAGNLGYELDVTTLSEAEKQEMKEQISFYKEHRKLVQYGTFPPHPQPFRNAERGRLDLRESPSRKRRSISTTGSRPCQSEEEKKCFSKAWTLLNSTASAGMKGQSAGMS